MYFDKLDLWSHFKDGRALHFAPEKKLSERIEHHCPDTYVKADLSPTGPDVQKVDATNIPFPDCHFDFIIFNHILEHIPDDRRALSELHRVLKPGGCAVLQTPYSSVLANSFSDPAIDTDDLKNLFYGQEDHMRVYGRDLFSRITAAGFTLCLKRHENILGEFSYSYYGVNPKEDLILVTKRGIKDNHNKAIDAGACSAPSAIPVVGDPSLRHEFYQRRKETCRFGNRTA
jgi:SAM-dependent methyltransferase